MSADWVYDIVQMHDRFGVNDAVDRMDDDMLKEYLEFRIKFLEEEMAELRAAVNNPEEIVDALIDLCVVAIGTLDAFAVNPYEAWNEVHRANMAKVPGVKESRPNPMGLPDLIKPEGWEPPSHKGNHGYLHMVPTT
jgi:predicted HAD superfamily Cof-like phosphohydrolase